MSHGKYKFSELPPLKKGHQIQPEQQHPRHQVLILHKDMQMQRNSLSEGLIQFQLVGTCQLFSVRIRLLRTFKVQWIQHDVRCRVLRTHSGRWSSLSPAENFPSSFNLASGPNERGKDHSRTLLTQLRSTNSLSLPQDAFPSGLSKQLWCPGPYFHLPAPALILETLFVFPRP